MTDRSSNRQTEEERSKNTDARNRPLVPSNPPTIKVSKFIYTVLVLYRETYTFSIGTNIHFLSLQNTRLEPAKTTKMSEQPKLEIAKSTRNSVTHSSSNPQKEDQKNENQKSAKRKATPLDNNAKRQKSSKKPETNTQKFQRVMKKMGIRRPRIVY